MVNVGLLEVLRDFFTSFSECQAVMGVMECVSMVLNGAVETRELAF